MDFFDDFSFQEKSALITLLAILFVYGGYFAELVSGGGAATLAGMLAAMIAAVVLLVIIEVASHIVIAIFDAEGAEEGTDERDLLVSGRAARISQVILGVGVLVVLGRILVRGSMDEVAGMAEVTLFEVANLLLFFFVLSELVNYGARLFFYRRGV